MSLITKSIQLTTIGKVRIIIDHKRETARCSAPDRATIRIAPHALTAGKFTACVDSQQHPITTTAAATVHARSMEHAYKKAVRTFWL